MVIKKINCFLLLIIVAFFIIGQLFISGCKKESEIEGTNIDLDFIYEDYNNGIFNFNATTSKYKSGFVWDFGDSSIENTGSSTNHTYNHPGAYSVTLSIVEGNVVKAFTKKEVQVKKVIVPTKAIFKSIELTKINEAETENDGTGPDISAKLFAAGGGNQQQYDTIWDIGNNSAPVRWFFTWTTKISINTVYIPFYEENKINTRKLIALLTINLNDYTSGPNSYPKRIPFKINSSEGNLYLVWE